ncbi:hypothetical protein Spico_0040 [Parasphaerochaeta coccoides DSM 17374]|uniref:Uncharacterized protein n=1 Tax=Parasphaerochaeta coccoides (strain ATCC BAA-1237 / DSM 17374 / SPN1) TaxID=760011 RepID=F4GIY7_PARC1|nr:hypothetical protein Spico_0040 [Parasphaerochaeta coccoides DSM 17374]
MTSGLCCLPACFVKKYGVAALAFTFATTPQKNDLRKKDSGSHAHISGTDKMDGKVSDLLLEVGKFQRTLRII